MDEKTYNQTLKNYATSITSQDVLDKYGIVEYNVDDIIRDFEDAYSYKTEQARIFKILDAADHSDIWKVFNRKIPRHVQTPTTNPITIIKEATKASIMPTSFQGEFKPLSLEARELAYVCNKYFAMKWEAADLDRHNNDAAEYAGRYFVLWQSDPIRCIDPFERYDSAVRFVVNPVKKLAFTCIVMPASYSLSQVLSLCIERYLSMCARISFTLPERAIPASSLTV